jgi:hypothetical protein
MSKSIGVETFLNDNTCPVSETVSNYFEIVVLETSNGIDKQNSKEFETFNTSLERDHFYSVMYKMMDSNYKYHQKQYKELIIGDVCYHNFKNEEMSIYSSSTNDIVTINKALCGIAQTRSKLSILSLPSTFNVYTENIVRKLVFRISNRIFVNFEHGMTKDKKYYKIFINYNHEKDVDTSNVITTIKKVVDILV